MSPITITTPRILRIIELGALMHRMTPEKYLAATLERVGEELYEELGESICPHLKLMADDDCDRILARYH